MKTILSNRVQVMKASQTLAMAKLSREMKAQGHDVVSLSLGEPDFETPDYIKEGIKQAVDNDFSHYTAIPGLVEVREAICAKFKRDNNLIFNSNQIVMSTGAKQSIAQVLMAVLNPGDEVILPAPYWVSYVQMIELAEGKPIEIPTTVDMNYKITPSQLEAAITSKTKAFLFSSPCNPSGSLYSQDELKALAEVLAKYPEILIISDEIYELINFVGKHHSIAHNPDVFNQTVIINGLSKGYAMTGYRLGYIAGPEWLAQACTKIQGQLTSAPCAVTQKAAQVALEKDPSELNYMKESFRARRDYMFDQLSEIEGFKLSKPQGAFYLFPDISSFFGKKIDGELISNAQDFATLLLQKGLVSTVSGSAFGSSNCLRIAYAAHQDNLEKAVARIKTFVSQLN